MVLEHLGKLSPGGEVIVLLHPDKGHVGVALCVWQEESSQGFLLWSRTSASLQQGAGEKGQDKAHLVTVSHRPLLLMLYCGYLELLNNF